MSGLDLPSVPNFSYEANEGGMDFIHVVTKFRTWPGSLMQAYVYCCNSCGKIYIQQAQYYGEPMRPGLNEWKFVKLSNDGEVWICGEHTVKTQVLIDGVEK